MLVKIKDTNIFYFNKHRRSKLRMLVSYALVFGKLRRLISLQSTYLFFSFTQLLVFLLFFWDTKQKRLASKVGIPSERVSLVWFSVVIIFFFWDTKLKRLASEKKKEVCFLWPLSLQDFNKPRKKLKSSILKEHISLKSSSFFKGHKKKPYLLRPLRDTNYLFCLIFV